MQLQTIAEHTVDISLLSGGVCIDVGCRGFQFSEAMRDLGLRVVAFDLEEMAPPNGIEFIACAISNESKPGYYVDIKDKQAKYLSNQGTPILVTSLNEVYSAMLKLNSDTNIDVLKLDCEGSEYLILSDPDFKPIPKQISVEFHMHAHRELHDKYFDKCIENLLRYYIPVKHELTNEHCAGENYWDSLFVLK